MNKVHIVTAFHIKKVCDVIISDYLHFKEDTLIKQSLTVIQQSGKADCLIKQPAIEHNFDLVFGIIGLIFEYCSKA